MTCLVRVIAILCTVVGLVVSLFGTGYAQRASEAINSNAAALFNSPHQVTLGNRFGNVTLVEFFDYNCGYCKNALSDLLNLMKSNPTLRVVLKEFPVLGPPSIEAAQVAVAVRMQDADGSKYISFHQKLIGGRGRADKERALNIAREVGLDMVRLRRDLDEAEIDRSLGESRRLASLLGISGTPSYVIGEQVVSGAVGIATLREVISRASAPMLKPTPPPKERKPGSLRDLFKT